MLIFVIASLLLLYIMPIHDDDRLVEKDISMQILKFMSVNLNYCYCTCLIII